MTKLRLKELRVSRGLTQIDMAMYLQIARGSYSRYETGEREMTYDALISLAELFAVSVDYLLGRYDANPMILQENEVSLINMLRSIDERGQRSIQAVVEHEYSQFNKVIKKSAM